jgi:nickel-type superoxide dismutase maturation protease
MTPTLSAGDWLLVDPTAFADRPPSVGELVLVPDPGDARRLLVKRVAEVLPGGAVDVRGDAPEASTDSRSFGAIDSAMIQGRPWFRYWPIRRVGRIR